MTEPVRVEGPRLFLNAICLFGRVRARLIEGCEEVAGYSLEECNGMARTDHTAFEFTWGEQRRTLAPLAGRALRLHLQIENAASLFSYRFGEQP
ncbi:MAG: hypothetical protein FJX77_03585 [Armatimonadetes bacterium]|nr:hypothetical protein [Armatimonadota bacterium]